MGVARFLICPLSEVPWKLKMLQLLEQCPLFRGSTVMTLKASSQYDATRAMRGVKCTCVRRNRLGFYSCVSCIHALFRIVNRA